MHRRFLASLLAASLLGGVMPFSRAAEEDPGLTDEIRLKAAGLSTSGPGLLEFFRLRAKGEVSAERLTELLDQLEDKEPAKREKACAELVAIGPPAIPLLRQAARDTDNPDLAALSRRCLRALEEGSAGLTAAALRLLAKRQPPGTAEVLLDFLPHAENEVVLEEARNALIGVAHDKGVPSPALIKALSDGHPLRRATAVTALCSRGHAEPRATLRKLLTDKMPSVRLRASLALAKAHDAKAVSTLVALLGELPATPAREVEAFLSDLAEDQAPKASVGDDELSRQRARDAWARWWLDTEGPGLLEELRKRTLSEALYNKAVDLIDKLGDDSFEVRQESEAELMKMGAVLMPLLKGALKHADLEVRTRAAKCLKTIEATKPVPLSPVTVRLVAIRKPKGADEALLGYMPFAAGDDEGLREGLQRALNAVAYPDGKASPLLVKALSDKKSAVRRGAAAEALASGPFDAHLPALRKLLKDKDPNVRLKVGLALAKAREAEAVPVLISLIAEVPSDTSASAEEYLKRVAGATAPKGLAEGDGARKKRSDAWGLWWAANKARVDLTDRKPVEDRPPYLGYTLLVQTNINKLVELDRTGKVRWELTGVINPWDASVLPGERVLVAEYSGQRVTERNLKGEVLWEKRMPPNHYPMYAERLRNGNTFIVCRNQLMEVNRAGREVFKYDRPSGDILNARRLPNGQIAFVTNNRQLIRLNRAGRETKAVFLTNVYGHTNEILNNGHVLVSVQYNNRVVEHDADGKEVKSFFVNQPTHAFRLPNGNTLVSSAQPAPGGYKAYEFDRNGKQVAEVATMTYTARVRRR
jgi:HEAT repeat protein